jgi:transcriptional regulator NrdR family protein
LQNLELKYWRPIDIEPPEADLHLPIWGNVKITSPLSYIYFLPIVQRLSEIKQLALTDSKYPGGNHTRLEHSLGVLSIARSIIDKMLPNLNDRDKSIIELGMLLHDIGHGGWGHALDGLHGYVMGLLEDDPDIKKLSRIDKLDVAVAWYLLRNNDQIRNGLRRVAEKLNVDLGNLEKAISLIIAEDPLLIRDVGPELRQVVLYGQTILGEPGGVGGVNADRIDWVLRDTFHLFGYARLPSSLKDLEGKLKNLQEYSSNIDKFLGSLMKNMIEGSCEIILIKDGDLLKEDINGLRDALYKNVYESEIKAFGDSLLLRLAFCAARALEIIGKEVASPSIYNRAIFGYILQPDHLLRESTKKILSAASEVLNIGDPLREYIRKGYDLLGLLDVFPSIVHAAEKRTERYEDIDIVSRVPYPNTDMYLSAFILRGKILVEGIEQLLSSMSTIRGSSLSPERILTRIQGFACSVKIDPIDALNIPSIEAELEKKFKEEYSKLKGAEEERKEEPKISLYVIIDHYFWKGLFNELNKQLPARVESIESNILSSDELRNILLKTLGEYDQKHFLRVLILYEKKEKISGDIEKKLAEEVREHVKGKLLTIIGNNIIRSNIERGPSKT